METQVDRSASQSAPQADGDSRPFRFDINERRRVHVEISGPAFSRTPVADHLAQSLQVQTIRAAGQVLQAIARQQLKDVFPAWRRLLKAMGYRFAPLKVEGIYPGDGTILWKTLRDVVLIAMASSDELVGEIRWLDADVVMRAAARQRAKSLDERLQKGTYADGSPLHADALVMILNDSRMFRAFAEDEVPADGV